MYCSLILWREGQVFKIVPDQFRLLGVVAATDYLPLVKHWSTMPVHHESTTRSFHAPMKMMTKHRNVTEGCLECCHVPGTPGTSLVRCSVGHYRRWLFVRCT